MSSAAGSSRESAANSTISDAVYRHNAAQVSRLQDGIASLMALPQELDLELDFEEFTEVEDVQEERRATVYGRHLNEQQAEALKPFLERAELKALQSNVMEALRREDAPYEDYFSDMDTDDESSSESILSEPNNVLLPDDRDLELDTARTAIREAQEIGKKFKLDDDVLAYLTHHGADPLPAGAEWSEAAVDDRDPQAAYALHSIALPEAWPSMEDQAYAANLAMHRVSQYGAKESRYIFEKEEPMRGIFTSRPNDNGQYYVRVFTGIDRASIDLGIPRPGTQLRLVLIDCPNLELRGHVIEEVRETKADLTLIVHAQRQDLGLSGQELSIRIKFSKSAGFYDHQVNAISRTISKQKRTKGFFLQHVVFASTIPANYVPCKISSPPTTADLEYSNTLKHTVEQLRLDTAQTAAAMMTLQSPVSATIIYGPSGTDTTTTIMSAVLGHVLAGAKVLVTSPTNGGVSALLKSWRKTLDSWKAVSGGKNNIRWTLFKGCYLSSKHSTNPPPTVVPDDELSDEEQARREMWIDVASQLSAGITTGHQQYGFARRRMEYAKMVLTYAESALFPAARFYVDNAGNVSKLSKQQKTLFFDYEELLSGSLIHTLQVVFCTCSISANEMLSTVFKPTVIVLDEAGCATTPDCAVPLTTFVESAELVILGGDPEKQPPVSLSENRNEALPMVQTSIVARHINSSHQALRLDEHIPVMKLDTQYRMQKDSNK